MYLGKPSESWKSLDLFEVLDYVYLEQWDRIKRGWSCACLSCRIGRAPLLAEKQIIFSWPPYGSSGDLFQPDGSCTSDKVYKTGHKLQEQTRDIQTQLHLLFRWLNRIKVTWRSVSVSIVGSISLGKGDKGQEDQECTCVHNLIIIRESLIL